MNYFRAFIAGTVLPTIVLPILLCTAITYGKPQLLGITFIHMIPVIWGIWNLLYFAICKNFLPGSLTVRYFLTGGSLGLLIAIYGIFWQKVPAALGFEEYQYYPLVLAPIVYAILWRYVVKPLNDLLCVKE
ncbi:MAG: hypothetical protein K940chlam7_00643 [Chlamydiae bacterium]|nr:hypothetical protein [Chlamydiota bacterium]